MPRKGDAAERTAAAAAAAMHDAHGCHVPPEGYPHAAAQRSGWRRPREAAGMLSNRRAGRPGVRGGLSPRATQSTHGGIAGELALRGRARGDRPEPPKPQVCCDRQK